MKKIYFTPTTDVVKLKMNNVILTGSNEYIESGETQNNTGGDSRSFSFGEED